MRMLVTGGAGFVGSTLVDRLLAEGHAVDVIDDLSTGRLANLADARSDRTAKLRIHQVDLRAAEVVDLVTRIDPDVVYHLATPAQADATDDAALTLVGTVRMLEAARQAGAGKFVVAFDADVHEATPRGATQRAVHEHLQVARERHGVEFTAVVLGEVYGPRQHDHGPAGVVARLATALAVGGTCTITGDGDRALDLVYVDDAVDALVRAAERGGGLLLNAGTGQATSVVDVFSLLASEAGVPGAEAAVAPARPDDVSRPPLDPTRAKIHLGWEPWTTVPQGVRQVLASWDRGAS
jgi:UDP-glucose 4-epimerase